jgi:hypothetical protein
LRPPLSKVAGLKAANRLPWVPLSSEDTSDLDSVVVGHDPISPSKGGDTDCYRNDDVHANLPHLGIQRTVAQGPMNQKSDQNEDNYSEYEGIATGT